MPKAPEHPNLLFIMTDDMGAWAMHCAGNSEIHTPNLDRLATMGMRMENLFCVSPVCHRSWRSCMISGASLGSIGAPSARVPPL